MAGSRLESPEGQPLAGAQRHQPVISRMVLDLVQRLADPVIGMEDRRAVIGEAREMLYFGAARRGAEFGEAMAGDVETLMLERVAQHPIRGEEIDVEKRTRLVRVHAPTLARMASTGEMHLGQPGGSIVRDL